MSDNNTPLVPDVIKSASNAVQANLPETVRQTDGIIATVVEFFNNVVLYPIKKTNITFEYKLEQFAEDLKRKTSSIPPESLQVPPVTISGPTLEALRYAYDEKELREMYENLLASAMDNRKVSKVHPAFVDAIRQMSPLDAQILTKLALYKQVKCAEIDFSINGTNQSYINGMPDFFVAELAEMADPFAVSASIANLQRLGIITISQLGLKGTDYEGMKQHPYVLKRIEMFKKYGKEFTVSLNERAIYINNYGERFVEVCIPSEEAIAYAG